MRKLPLHQIRTNPSWLHDKIQQFRTDDLACFVNVDMFQHIVAEFVQEDWAPPCRKMITTLEKILEDSLQAAMGYMSAPAPVPADGPQHPVRLAMFATGFLLREVEACTAVLSAWTLDHDEQELSWKMFGSKSDHMALEQASSRT